MSASVTVFVVDDDESVRRAMLRLLKASRFRAICASSIEELLALELPTSDAVIVVDASTNRLHVSSLPGQLRARGSALPVIYLTDIDTERTRLEAGRMGAAGYFRKPVDEQALVDAISFAAWKAGGQKTQQAQARQAVSVRLDWNTRFIRREQ